MNCDGDSSVCVTCQDGYYVSSGTCYNCQTSCLTCTSSTVCTSCAATHYLLANGRCKQLPSNCIEVDSNGDCSKCSYGYQVSFGVCFACSPSAFNVMYEDNIVE